MGSSVTPRAAPGFAASRDRRPGSIPACRRRNRGGRDRRAGRKEVEDAAADRILARIGHRAGAAIAEALRALDQACHAHDIAGRELLLDAAKKSRGGTRCRHGIDGGQHDQGSCRLPLPPGELGERADRRGDDLGIGRDPVIRTRCPRRGSSAASRPARRSASASSSVASRWPSRAICRIGCALCRRPARRQARRARAHRGLRARRSRWRRLAARSDRPAAIGDFGVSAMQALAARQARARAVKAPQALPSARRARRRRANVPSNRLTAISGSGASISRSKIAISASVIESIVCSAKRPSRKSNSFEPRCVAR